MKIRLFSSAWKVFTNFERPDNNLKTLFQEDFIKMLPGMERKLTEHMMVHHYTATASEASGRSLQEVPLLKGSFGHHSSSIGGVASSSQESLYGGGVGVGGHPHLPSGSSNAGPMLSSDSLHSLRGHHLRYCTIYCNDNVTTNEKSIYIK